MNNRYNSPCFDPVTKTDCPDRCAEPNCHDICEKFIEFRAFMDKKNKDEHSELKDYMNDNNRTMVMY